MHIRKGFPESRNEARKVTQSAAKIMEDEQNGIFRVLDIGKRKSIEERNDRDKRPVQKVGPPRHTQMLPDQDWGSVWPAARTFHPASVPLPVRQGIPQVKTKITPSKFANTELMKIPNFLHLTPPVVKRHCAAIRKFCTPWPKGLETGDDVDNHFPLQVITSDYLSSSSSVRDRRSRVVVLKFKLSSLKLIDRAKDKIIRLLDQRYDHETDTVTLVSDRCPYRNQNIDYTKYLITALYFESNKAEAWENKGHMDAELYVIPESEQSDFELALQEVLNQGENEDSLKSYKEEARKLMDLPPENVEATIENS